MPRNVQKFSLTLSFSYQFLGSSTVNIIAARKLALAAVHEILANFGKHNLHDIELNSSSHRERATK